METLLCIMQPRAKFMILPVLCLGLLHAQQPSNPPVVGPSVCQGAGDRHHPQNTEDEEQPEPNTINPPEVTIEVEIMETHPPGQREAKPATETHENDSQGDHQNSPDNDPNIVSGFFRRWQVEVSALSAIIVTIATGFIAWSAFTSSKFTRLQYELNQRIFHMSNRPGLEVDLFVALFDELGEPITLEGSATLEDVKRAFASGLMVTRRMTNVGDISAVVTRDYFSLHIAESLGKVKWDPWRLSTRVIADFPPGVVHEITTTEEGISERTFERLVSGDLKAYFIGSVHYKNKIGIGGEYGEGFCYEFDFLNKRLGPLHDGDYTYEY